MLPLSGNTEAGQNIMFYVYWVCLFFLLLFLFVHVMSIINECNQPTEVKLTRQATQNLARTPFVDVCPCFSFITYNALVHAFTLIAILTGIGYILASVLPYHQFDHKNCKWDGPQGAMIFAYHKFFIYCCLTVRLQASYVGSAYAYSTTVIGFLNFLNVSIMVVLPSVLDVLLVKKSLDSIAKNGGYICKIGFPFWGSALTALLDLIMNITLLLLFIRPLMALARQQHQNMMENHRFTEFTYTGTGTGTTNGGPTSPVPAGRESRAPSTTTTDVTNNNNGSRILKKPSIDIIGGKEDPQMKARRETVDVIRKQQLKEIRKTSQFYKLSIKVTVLTFVMVVATCIALGIYSQLVWTIGLVIDIDVNCLCLLLMFKNYDWVYQRFCKCCDICFGMLGTIGFAKTKVEIQMMTMDIQESQREDQPDDTMDAEP